MDAFVDWLQFTYHPGDACEEAIDQNYIIENLLMLDPGKFKECKGMYGYRSGVTYNYVSVYYDGTFEMGYHIQVTGKGCRFLDSIDGFDWAKLFSVILGFGCKVSRLDIAIDDTEYLNISKIKYYIKNKLFVSRFGSCSIIDDTKLKTGEVLGETIYLGRKISEFFIRIYDKNLESDGSIKSVRFETVMRNDRATMFVQEYMKPENFGNIGFLIRKVINNYIRFVKNVEKHSSRSINAEWWENFIVTAEKCKLSKGRSELTLEKVCDWLEKQVASSLKLISRTKGELYIYNIIDKATMNDTQRKIVDEYRRQKYGTYN